MKKPERRPDRVAELREEYDFSRGVRGKYAARCADESNVVVLAPDVARAFRNEDEVNRALRSLIAPEPSVRTTGTRRRKSRT